MTRFLIPALVAVSSVAASAQDGSGLTFGGDVKLDYTDVGSGVLALDGDVAASWRSGGVLGFDASLDATYLDDGSDFTNLWAALVLSTGAGEFAVGAPRPLVESLGVMPRFSTSRVIDLESMPLRGTFAPLVSALDNGMTPGVTWKQEAGNLTFGAGYHHLNDRNVDLAQGVMRYSAGATSLFINGEYATAPGEDVTTLQIGGLHDAERFDLGAAFTRVDGGAGINSVRLHGSVDVMSALTVRGDALLIQDTSDIYSVSATYNLDSGLYVEGGGTKVVGQDEILDIGVGYKF